MVLSYLGIYIRQRRSPPLNNVLAGRDLNMAGRGRIPLRKWKDLPFVSITLVAINVLVFIACSFTGEWLYDRGELHLWGVLGNHEYGRILWAMFLHANENHIFNNMVILFFLGAMLEKEIGHMKYTLIYFFSGIAGNISSLAAKYIQADMAASLGASGAIFGLDGLLLALVLFSGKKMQNVTVPRTVLMVVLSLYSGFTGQNIDNAAHVGGLLAGFLCGLLICLKERITDNQTTSSTGLEY